MHDRMDHASENWLNVCRHVGLYGAVRPSTLRHEKKRENEASRHWLIPPRPGCFSSVAPGDRKAIIQ